MRDEKNRRRRRKKWEKKIDVDVGEFLKNSSSMMGILFRTKLDINIYYRNQNWSWIWNLNES